MHNMSSQCLPRCQELQAVIATYLRLQPAEETLGRYTLAEIDGLVDAYKARLHKPPSEVSGKETSGVLGLRFPWFMTLVVDACAEYIEDEGYDPDKVFANQQQPPHVACAGAQSLVGRHICGAVFHGN